MEKIITDPFIIRGIIAGIAVALVSGLVGCFVVWRRLSYYGESIAHSSLLGAGIGILIGVGINFGVVFVCLCFGILFLLLQQSKSLSSDTLLGVIAHFALSIGIIVISFNKIKIDLHAFLFGDILTVSPSDIWGMYIGVIIAVTLILSNCLLYFPKTSKFLDPLGCFNIKDLSFIITSRSSLDLTLTP